MEHVPDLDDATADGLVSGDPEAAAAHPQLADLLGDLRVAYRRDVTPAPDATTLVAAATPDDAPGGTTMTRSHARHAGRALVGALVALLATAGLAVAGALPAPVGHLVEPASHDVEVPEGDTPVTSDDPDGTPEDDGEAGVDEPEAADANSHGKEVSELARTTELRGCEKGRAVSALASGREVDERAPCPHVDADDEGDGEDAEPEADDEDADVDDADNGEPEGARGRSAEAPGHTKRP